MSGRTVSLGIASGLLFWLAVLLFQTAIANDDSDRAEAIMHRWALLNPPRAITPREIARVRRLLAESPGIDPPEHHARKVQLNLWTMANQALSPTDRQHNMDDALMHARHDVYARPGWPLAWARLLLCKIQRAEYDGEFKRALERTTTLGHWHRKLHLVVLASSLPVYEQLGNEEQLRILDTGIRGLKQSPTLVLAYLKVYGRLNDVCTRLAEENAPLHKSYCQG